MANRFRNKNVDESVEPQLPPQEEPVEEPAVVEEPQMTDDIASVEPARERKPSRVAQVLGGDMLGDKMVLKQIPLVMLVLFYLLLVVGNRYRVEQLSREKMATEENINYLRQKQIEMQKRYQQSVKISQIAEDLKGTGVGITAGPPYEID